MPNFSGKWTLTEQAQGIAAGTWTGITQYELYTWGNNNDGGLFQNNTTRLSSPVQVGALTNWSSVAIGDNTTVAIKTDGTIWTAGRNTTKKLGLGDNINRSSPVQIGALTDWYQASNFTEGTLAIKTNNSLWFWGQNVQGISGSNNSAYAAYLTSSPVQIGALTDWYQVSAGFPQAFSIKTDGTLWAWGGGGEGALGLNDNNINRSSPVQVGSLTDWSQVSSSPRYFGAAIKTDGTLWTWGQNRFNGKLGHNNIINRSSPVQVGALTNWAQVSAGSENWIAVKTDGTLWSCGAASYGTLGNNTAAGNKSSPIQIGALTTWAATVTDNFGTSAFAIKTDGTLWAWGNNSIGQLGTNNTISLSSPVQVGALTTWDSVASAGGPSAAINQSTT